MSKSIEECLEKKGEHIVLHLKKNLGHAHFRYVLAEGKDENGCDTYSVYAEYTDENAHTVGGVPDFSDSREMSESFCRLLARTLATPLSLEAIYEDSLTP